MQFPSLIEKKSITLNTELLNQICHLSLLRKQGLCHCAVYPSINLFSTFKRFFCQFQSDLKKGQKSQCGYKSESRISSSIERKACRTQLLYTPFGSNQQDKSVCAYLLATQHTHSSRSTLFHLIGVP